MPKPQPEDTLVPLWNPNVGDPVVDLSTGRVGEYRGQWGNLWQLAPLHGGKPWSADPAFVRTATLNERVRDGMARAKPVADAERA